MRKFVSGELNALEFAQEFSDRLLADREEAKNFLAYFCFSLLPFIPGCTSIRVLVNFNSFKVFLISWKKLATVHFI